MTGIETWSSITTNSLQSLWRGFINFIPEFLAALVVFIVGWLLSVWIGKIIVEILKRLKFDKIFEKNKWNETLEKAEFKMTVSEFVGAIIKWILIIVFLLAAVEILGLSAFASFLGEIVGWLPNLVVAMAIFIVAVVLADFSEKLVKAIMGKMQVGHTKFMASVVKWSIWIFAILAILSQLGVAKEIVQIIVTGFVALIVVSASIAFGLGGRELARETLENLKKKARD